MLDIKLTRQNDRSLSLSLPCALTDLITGDAPFYIDHGSAELAFHTGSEKLDTALTEQFSGIAANMKQCVTLVRTLKRLDEQGKETLAGNLTADPYVRSWDELIGEAADLIPRWFYPHEDYERWLKGEIEQLRLTGGELFEKVIALAKENGDLERFHGIEDYTLPADRSGQKIEDYRFDLCTVPSFGGSEGIYLDCFIRGDFGARDKQTLPLGTMKTLATDLDACKIVGEICGVLLYYESQFVNENLYRFTPKDEIQSILSKPFAVPEMEQMEQDTQQEASGRFPEMTM